MAVHPARSRIAGFVCLLALTLPGCGGGGEPATEPEATIGPGTGESTYRSESFSFVLPSGWAERPASSPESYGRPISAASVAPEGAAPSSLVVVLAYDVTRLPPESPDGPRAWFDWYAQWNEAELIQPPSEVALGGAAALEGSLTWTDHLGNPVDVRIVRALHGGLFYLIQCQTEPMDRVAIAVGCETIVATFRAT